MYWIVGVSMTGRISLGGGTGVDGAPGVGCSIGHVEKPSRTAEVALNGIDRDEVELRSRKITLRRRLLTERAAMTEPERFNAGRSLRDVVLSLPEAQMAGTVAAY